MVQTISKGRLESHKSKILQMLYNAGDVGVLNIDMAKLTVRYGSSIHMLRKEGYVIKDECVNVNEGIFKYTLVSEPKTTSKEIPKAFELLLSLVEEEGGQVTTEQLESIFEEYGICVRYKSGTFK